MTDIDPKTMRAAHIVEQGREWGPRGYRMRTVRPADPEALVGHLCACGHGEASHVATPYGRPCTGQVEAGTGCFGYDVCSCSDFEHAYCVYGSGCEPGNRCHADEHFDGRRTEDDYVCGDACGGKCAEADLCARPPEPIEEPREFREGAPFLEGDIKPRPVFSVGQRVREVDDTGVTGTVIAYRDGRVAARVGGLVCEYLPHEVEPAPDPSPPPGAGLAGDGGWRAGDRFATDGHVAAVTHVFGGGNATAVWDTGYETPVGPPRQIDDIGWTRLPRSPESDPDALNPEAWRNGDEVTPASKSKTLGLVERVVRDDFGSGWSLDDGGFLPDDAVDAYGWRRTQRASTGGGR